MAAKPQKKKESPTLSRSLAVTMVAGITFVLLFVYGAAGFLLYQYFRENPAGSGPIALQASVREEPEEMPPEEVLTAETPRLRQPEQETVAAYMRSIDPVEKSLEQVAELKRSVVLIEAGGNQGSGVLIGSQGHIVTNFHVIDASPYMAKAVFDLDADGTEERELMLLGYDMKKDLAILQVKNGRGVSLNPVPLGRVESLSEGQRIVSIGSPRGLMNTVSDGIISGIRQFDQGTYIQITAPISPGNSGGALLNMYGELIGLTTFQITESENLNFAISSDDIKSLIDANPHWINP